jgi:hypothetical protein
MGSSSARTRWSLLSRGGLEREGAPKGGPWEEKERGSGKGLNSLGCGVPRDGQEIWHLQTPMLEADLGGEKEGLAETSSTAYKISTIDVYAASIVELYGLKVSTCDNRHPNPRGVALRAMLETFRRQQSAVNRESFVDRGAGGLTSGYLRGGFHENEPLPFNI